MARLGNRGVSTALGYVFTLGISAVLVTMLLVAAGTLVEDQRERAIRDELEAVGERVAGSLEAADRLALASDDGTVRVSIALPARVTGRPYTVEVRPGPSPVVVLTTENPAVTVRVPFETTVPVTATTVPGGRLVVTYRDDTLEVTDA